MHYSNLPPHLHDVIGLGEKGIFTAMSKLDDYQSPWGDEMSPAQLDMRYIYNHSGEKRVSPLLSDLLVLGEDYSNNLAIIAKLIYCSFKRKWAKLWNTVIIDYNPISNYDMTEISSSDIKDDITVNQSGLQNDTISKSFDSTDTETLNTTVNFTHTPNTTVSITDTPNLSTTEKTQPNLTTIDTIDYGSKSVNSGSVNSDSAASVYGFNSSNPVPSNAADNTSTSSGTEEKSGTDTHTISQTGGQTVEKTERGDKITKTTTTGSDNDVTSNTGTDTLKKGGSENETISGRNSSDILTDGLRTIKSSLSRSGNIGVTTSQQMLQSERDLLSWDYFNSIFEDVDTILTIGYCDF